MQPDQLRSLSRFTRRFLPRRTPGLYGLCKLLLRGFAPKSRHYEAPIRSEVADGVMELDLNASLEYTVFFRGRHEPEVGQIIRRVVPSGGVCLDVGANVGAHTLTMARAVGPGGRVIALEPHPQLFERLARNVELNELAHVELVHAALADRDGEVDFHVFREGSFQQGISSLAPVESETVPSRATAVSGSTLLRRIGLERCDLIKIDVEGFEPVALAELRPLIERARPYIVFEHRLESWKSTGVTVAEVLKELEQVGYAFYVVRKSAPYPLAGFDSVPPECDLLCEPASVEAR